MESPGIPSLPVEVLVLLLNKLGEVQDLCRVASVCREWRQIITFNSEEAWKSAFMRDYSHRNPNDYSDQSLGNWRSIYIAYSLGDVVMRLRDNGSTFDDLLDSEAALERAVQSILQEMHTLDRSASQARFHLDQMLQDITGNSMITFSSSPGRTFLESINNCDPNVPSSDGLLSIQYNGVQKTLTMSLYKELKDAHKDLQILTEGIRQKKDAMQTLLDAIKVQHASSERISATIRSLRSKRASLEIAKSAKAIE